MLRGNARSYLDVSGFAFIFGRHEGDWNAEKPFQKAFAKRTKRFFVLAFPDGVFASKRNNKGSVTGDRDFRKAFPTSEKPKRRAFRSLPLERSRG